jgi:hypothetical protein
LKKQGIAIKEIVRRTGYSRRLIRKILRTKRLREVSKWCESASECDPSFLREVNELPRRSAFGSGPLAVSNGRQPLLSGSFMKAELKAAHVQGVECDPARRLHKIHETNDRFHAELFGLCNNALLESLIELYGEMTYAMRDAAFADPEKLDKSRGHHRIMIQLLTGIGSWALAQICIDHIQLTKDQYLAGLRSGS